MIAANTPEAARDVAASLRDKEIARLEAEVQTLRAKRSGLENAITFRSAKLNRLKSQRVLDAAPISAFPALACCA